MLRSFDLVDHKIAEAEYFLLELRRVGDSMHFPAVQYCASAFAAAARSVTFAMQASIGDDPDFTEWYHERQGELRENELARFFNDFRRITQHIGESVVGGGAYGDGDVRYFFLPTVDLPEVPSTDVVSACEQYFKVIVGLVFDCYVEHGPVVDAQQYFTKEHFEKLGRNIEDAEEELGWPRGWTDIGDPEHEPYRWEHIRRNADGCRIENQFDAWLGKRLPRIGPLPPFPPHG